MKKLFLLVALLLTITFYSQTQTRVVYNAVYSEQTGELPLQNIFLFNYENKEQIKVYTASGEIMIFEQLTNFKEGKTKSGYKYKSAMFLSKFDNEQILLQIFNDKQFGIRITFGDNEQIQFLE